MQHRDAALNSAAAAAHRLQANGVVDDDDDEIEQNLITLQQAEVEQFQSRVDTGTAKASGLLSVLESELSEVTATHGAYPDAESIVQQLTVYTGLEAIAQADGRAGLPVGAAYVREASRYFTTYVLANSEKIRKSDQDNVTSDDSAAAAFPVWLILGDAFVLVWFGVGFIALAWFSRRTFNAGAVAAMLAVLALSGWSLSAVLPAKDRVEGYAAPAGARRVTVRNVLRWASPWLSGRVRAPARLFRTVLGLYRRSCVGLVAYQARWCRVGRRIRVEAVLRLRQTLGA